MISFGQPDKLTVERDELEILFSVKEINKLSNEANPCEEDEQYSFSTCLHEFAILKSNCRIDFFGRDSSSNNFCTKDGFKLYIDTLKYLKQEDISKIKKVTGCNPKCNTIHYTYEKNLQKIKWKTNWMSEVYVQPKSSVVDYSTEYYSFDLNDLISSVGGNLGLFLGWSFLTFVEAMGFLLIFINVSVKLLKN